MKTLNIQVDNSVMVEDKKVEILAFINVNWDKFETKEEMAKYIENAYIFGEIADNEHYKIDDIMELINIVDLEKNPLPIPEVVEEPLLEDLAK